MEYSKRPVAFVMTATHHGSMLVNRHDYRLTPNGGYGVGFQLLNHSAFDPDEITVALQLLQLRRQHFGDGVIAIDCGANIGVHTIEWAKALYGWGEVISVEAQERVFYALAGNITLNNCFNARAIWAAIGEKNGSIDVPEPDYFKPSSFGSLEIKPGAHNEFIGQTLDYSAAGTIKTRMLAIDGLGLQRLDFIKIDIEGMEMEALRGAKQTLARCKPQLIIEKIKSDEAAITAFVSALGYKTFTLGINILAIHYTDPSLAAVTPHPPAQS